MNKQLRRREFLRIAGAGTTGALLSTLTGCNSSASAKSNSSTRKPNILFISADDMSFNSLGCSGCEIPNITPNLDKLASEGLLLDHCHIVSPVCGPSRHAWITGALPHQSGYMGHYIMPPKWFGKSPVTTNVPQLLDKQANYFTGAICKIPDNKGWNWTKSNRDTGAGRDPSKYYALTKEFIALAKSKDKPFFLHANSMDPHDYWARQKHETSTWSDAMMGKGNKYERYPNGKAWPDPSVDYQPDEVPVLSCWPDNKEIRKEIHTYYNSVKRLDDTVGQILKALHESGEDNNTMVVFVSDHGMGKAFAKWSLYPLGTRTPLIVRWPGMTKSGRRDNKSVVSTIDFAPTFLEVAGLKPQSYMHGASLLPIFAGNKDHARRETAVTYWNYMNNRPELDAKISKFSSDIAEQHNNYRPMRAISSRRYTYIWNAWANGKREIPIDMSAGQAIRRILMETGHAVRADFEKFRTKEEFYDTVADPGCLQNLIKNSKHKDKIKKFRDELLKVMTETGDHEAKSFQNYLDG